MNEQTTLHHQNIHTSLTIYIEQGINPQCFELLTEEDIDDDELHLSPEGKLILKSLLKVQFT